MKRILAMILCLMMLTGVLMSCKADTPTVTDETTDAASETVTDVVVTESQAEETTEKVFETDADGYVKDTITEDMVYNGEEIRILGMSNAKNYTLPENNGNGKDLVLNKVYAQRLAVAARLDITLTVDYVASYAQSTAEFRAKACAEDADWDLIQCFSLFPMVLAQEGRLKNLNNLKYPVLEMPWWPDTLSEFEQYGSLFFVANNSSVLSIRSAEVVFAHQEKLASVGLQDPVELVVEGNWTVETMLRYAKAFAGDAAATPGEAYGLVVDDFSRMDSFYYSAGFTCTKNNAQGVAELAFKDPGVRDRINTYIDVLVDAFKGQEFGIAADSREAMKRKQTALMVGSLANIHELTDTTTYAALPMPKLDDQQEDYITIQNNGYDMWCMPKTVWNPELAGVFLEAIASSEYRSVAPYYYEIALKDRYSTNALGVQAFDIIRRSITHNFGRAAQFSMGVVLESWWRSCFNVSQNGIMVKSPQNVFESKYAAGIDNLEIKLQEILADYRKYRDQ